MAQELIRATEATTMTQRTLLELGNTWRVRRSLRINNKRIQQYARQGYFWAPMSTSFTNSVDRRFVIAKLRQAGYEVRESPGDLFDGYYATVHWCVAPTD